MVGPHNSVLVILTDSLVQVITNIYIVTCRFLSLPELLHRLDDLQHSYCTLARQVSKLKEKIALMTENVGITLNDESDHLIRDTTTS